MTDPTIRLPRPVVERLGETVVTAIQRLAASTAPAAQDVSAELEFAWLATVEATARHDALVQLWGPTLRRPEMPAATAGLAPVASLKDR